MLICTRLLEEERITGTINLKSFYLRRLFRIQPAALAYLAVIATLMAVGVLGHAFHALFYAAVFVRNWLPLTSRPDEWYTMHFWSLSLWKSSFIWCCPRFFYSSGTGASGSLLPSCVPSNSGSI